MADDDFGTVWLPENEPKPAKERRPAKPTLGPGARLRAPTQKEGAAASPAPPPPAEEAKPEHSKLIRIEAAQADDIGRKYPLSDDAQAVLRDGMTPESFLDQLRERKLNPDAVRFLAYGLPRREAVLWACQCARLRYGDQPAPKAAQVLQAAENWLREPTEDHRRQAEQSARAAGSNSAAAWVGLAVFWSGESLAPPESPPIPPDQSLTAQAVAAAILMASVAADPEQAQQRQRDFIELGMRVARGESQASASGEQNPPP